jgi:phosphoesterase RecJ-like protein
MQNTIDWRRFAEVIRSASKIILTIHQRPDGDCIGSALAMRLILLHLGKDVRIFAPHKTPPTLAFLDPEYHITALEDMTEEDARWMQAADLFCVLDTSSWAQLGDMATLFRESTAQKIVLDHHVKGDNIGAETFIDSTAEATGALVVQAADALGVPMTTEIAKAAFVALATDTGWFRFSSVTSDTFRTAGKLLDAGVQHDAMYREIYEQESLGRIRLIGRTLSKAESHLDGQFLLTWILLEDFEAAGARSSDSEDIVNMLLQVRGTKMAALISELKDKTFKVSFRSRCEVDCSVLAAQFGGGGHKKAAGSYLSPPFDQAKQSVIEAVTKMLQDEANRSAG